MDGKILLIVGAVLLAATAYIGTQEITLTKEVTGPAETPRRLTESPNVRHENIRAALLENGEDLDDPESYVFEREGFSVVGGPVAATEHGKMVWVTDVFPWHLRPEADMTPGTIKPLRLLPTCAPEGPAAGSRLAHIYSGPTLRPVSLWAYTQQELYSEGEALISRVRNEGLTSASNVDMARSAGLTDNPILRPEDRYQFSIFDVAVSEVEHPVHLVLQSRTGRTMWNLSLAPGARISGITVLGGDIVALSNVPKHTPIEALTRSALDACGLRQARALRQTDALFAAVDAGLIDTTEAWQEIARHTQFVADWNTWFEEHFGFRADETRIGHDMGAVAALVGPIPTTPEEKVGWHGFDGRTIWMTPHYGNMKQSKMGPNARFKIRIEKQAKKILGADLSTIAPKGVN